LGVEIAKNCILAGLHSLVIADPLEATSFDLGGNFYLKSGGGAAQCPDSLAELNPYVAVSVASELTELTAEHQLEPLLDTGVSCLAITVPLPKETLIALNNKCRKVEPAFIYTVTTGVFNQVFCDFGEAFVCSDKDGNPPATSQIESIFQEGENVVVRVLEDRGRHGLETGDVVLFARLKGVEGSLAGRYQTFQGQCHGAVHL
jgi:ubiquitin-activating enzyme E1